MNAVETSSRIFYDPVVPIPLLILGALCVLFLTVYTYQKEHTSIGKTRIFRLLFFRLSATAILFWICLNPQREVSQTPKQLERKAYVAVDVSASMQHADDGQQSRLEHARQIIDRSIVLGTDEEQSISNNIELYTFAQDANATDRTSLAAIEAVENDTRFHRSMTSLLQNVGNQDVLAGIILLSDGHDFELVNPARTALEARSRDVAIYTVAIGTEKPIRDAAIRIASYQPYVFSGQHSRLDVAIRLIGCEYETFSLTLYREGRQVETREVSVGDELQRLESFQVIEEEPGQYAYEVRLSTVRDEVSKENNSATTFLNVSNKKINLLILEGAPFWDTNFTQRSLWGNDKFSVDAIVAVAPGKVRTLRKDVGLGPLPIPDTAEAFDAYDCILLGNNIEHLLNGEAQSAIVRYVNDFGGNVILMRGEATSRGKLLDAITPVTWGSRVGGFSEIEIERSGRSLAPFEALSLHAGKRSLRSLVQTQETEERPLATVLASARVAHSPEPVPVMIHRRFGSGQTLAITSSGFWRTGFHAELATDGTLFDQFWDNLILWMIAGRSTHSSGDYSVLLNTANLPFGQPLHMRLNANTTDSLPAGIPVEIYRIGAQEPVHRSALSAAEKSNRFTMSYTATEPGIYEARVSLPNGELETLRFAVYRDDRERTEISTDRQYLSRLAELSGGREIRPEELAPLLESLLKEPSIEPLKYREPIWDTVLVAWSIALLLSMDWLCRRRWGLC